MNYFDTLFAKKYGVGGGSMFATLFGKSLGGATPPAPVMPSKGDIIAVDMDGDGTAENYLVLKEVGEGVYELLARVNIGTGKWADSGQTYENSIIDNYFNSTYYATLSETAKAAIVDRTFRQDAWLSGDSGSPVYNGNYNTSHTAYSFSLSNATFGNEITRHIYALSLQDIIDYLEATPEMTSENTTITMANVQEMFNTTTGNLWSRSANTGTNYWVCDPAMSTGIISHRQQTNNSTNIDYRPAFQLDLTKIEWTPVEA